MAECCLLPTVRDENVFYCHGKICKQINRTWKYFLFPDEFLWMAPDKSKWVCRFFVEDPHKHKNGFTVYKLTSVVFPSCSPEAGTKLVVWKRFNDFKRLHNVIKESCMALKIHGLPDLCKSSFFNRFDEEVIQERVKSAQRFVDFIAGNKALFLGEEFKEFCEQGYKMGQGESIGYEAHNELYLDDNHWKWTDDRWRSEEDSSDDESGAASSDSGTSFSPRRNNNAESTNCSNNNNVLTPCHVTAPCEDPEEVLDVAGGGDHIPKYPAPETDSEVVCHSERPVPVEEIWLAIPPAEDRLAAYRVVGVLDPILVVVHSSRPQVRLALKVLRKSSWPVLSSASVGEPRPVPHMVRLIDWIETEDAVFIVTELIIGGKLASHLHDTINEDTTERVPAPDPTSEVDILVTQAQRLLASVNRTLERSAEQHQQLKTAESALETRGRKPRSRSVLPRARLERRFSSDDATGLRPRTAHGSLERVSRKHLKIATETAVREWGAGIVAGLDSLHSRGLIWKDLHPGNLLWGPGGHLLLTFQHQWKAVETRLHPSALAGLFVAPEVLSVYPYSPACDWWSVGVLLYELLTGVPLVEDFPTGLNSHTILDLPDFLSIEAQSLLIGLLQYEPNDRLGGGAYGSEEIKSHPFFHQVDWDEIYNEL